MFLKQITDNALAQNAYLIACQRTGEAIIIDPERDVDRYLDLAEKEGFRIVAVADTHIHADYLSTLELRSLMSAVPESMPKGMFVAPSTLPTPVWPQESTNYRLAILSSSTAAAG